MKVSYFDPLTLQSIAVDDVKVQKENILPDGQQPVKPPQTPSEGNPYVFNPKPLDQPDKAVEGKQKALSSKDIDWRVMAQTPGQTFPTVAGIEGTPDTPPVYTVPGAAPTEVAKMDFVLIMKGAQEGHPFYGNQYVAGKGSPDGGAKATVARVTPHPDHSDEAKQKALTPAQTTEGKKGLRGRLTEATDDQRKVVQTYMDGFSKNLKNPAEKAYAETRIRQMVAGDPRPKGMSGEHGLTKQRAVQYEILINNIFQRGREKHGI